MLGLAQPLVSKHLRVLQRGRRWSTCARKGGSGSTGSTVSALKPIHDWVKSYERSWSERFEQLDVVLEELEAEGGKEMDRDGE